MRKLSLNFETASLMQIPATHFACWYRIIPSILCCTPMLHSLLAMELSLETNGCGEYGLMTGRVSTLLFSSCTPSCCRQSVWQEHFGGRTVMIRTDNMALISAVNKLYAEDSSLNWLTKKLALLCMTSDVYLIGRHVTGKNNTKTDMLLRGQIAEFRRQFPMMNPCPVHPSTRLLPKALLSKWNQFLHTIFINGSVYSPADGQHSEVYKVHEGFR